jgi:hypothetical protein
MLLVYPEEQESEQDQDDDPDPAVAAFFCGVGGLKPRGRMRNRQRLVHLLLLLECQGSKHSDYQQYFLIRKMECRSHHLSSRHAVRPITENLPMVQIAPDFKAELGDRDLKPRNSPRLAHARHLMDDAMGRIVAA